MYARPIPVQRRLAPLDPAERRRHKLRNLAQSALLLGGMVVLLGLVSSYSAPTGWSAWASARRSP
jgi:hypothetical protein